MQVKSFTLALACLFIFLFFSQNVKGQEADTLTIAKKLRSAGKIHDAYTLLENYYTNHQHDLNTQWLFAQTAYWAKDIKTSQYLYTKAITEYPNNYYLKLDYALMLTELGKTDNAAPLLYTYLQYDSTNVKALTALSRAQYWKGNFNTSLSLINYALAFNKGDADAEELKKEILAATAPVLLINSKYAADDQPFQAITPAIQFQWPVSAFINPVIKIQSSVFINNSNTKNSIWAEAGNSFNFTKQKLSVSLLGGYFKYPYNSKAIITGNIDIKKTFATYLQTNITALFNPYTATLASLDTNITFTKTGIEVLWNKDKGINASAQYNINFFKDNNSVQNASAWVLSPALKLKTIQLKAGYSFSFSTSANNLFTPDFNKINNGTSSSVIPGIYNPYFTPYKQQSHSAIVSLQFSASKKLNISLNGGYAFYGSVMNPSFTYSGLQPGASTYSKSFSKENFNPAQVNTSVNFIVNHGFSMQANYTWLKTFFYIGNYASLGFKINFIDAKQ